MNGLYATDAAGDEHDVHGRRIGIRVVDVGSWPLRTRQRPGLRTDQRDVEATGRHAEHLERTEYIEQLEAFEQHGADS